MANPLRIASRRSQLAMVQTHWVRDELGKAHAGLEITVEAMATKGDKILDVALAKIGDKGLFTKELEAQMLVNLADIAVHSLKDLPTNLPEGLMLGCITEREDPADALVVHAKHQDKTLATLPPGCVVGTSSLRRLAQLRHHYPHLTFKATSPNRRRGDRRPADVPLRAEEWRLGDQRPILESGHRQRHSEARFGRGVDDQEQCRRMVASDPPPPRGS